MTTKKPMPVRDRYAFAKKQRNTAKYRRQRRAFLASNPLCVICKENGKTVAANQLDHIRPVHTHPELFWDKSNWQALCFDCHNAKTAEENLKWKPDATWQGLENELRRLIDGQVEEV